MPDNQPSYYAIIPAVVRYCPDLPAGAKLLYGEITALANNNGHCWANNAYFSKRYQVQNKTVSLWIKALKDLGFVSLEYEPGKSRFITPIAEKLQPPGIEKNVMPPGNKSNGGIENNVMPPGNKSNGGIENNVIPQGNKSNGSIENNVIHNNKVINTGNIKENEAALDFLKINYPGRMQAWEMKFKKQIQDYNRFCEEFNSIADIEELKFNDRVLFGRLDKYGRAWIRNQGKYNKPTNPEPIPVYLRNCE